jgi:hypothetical protein
VGLEIGSTPAQRPLMRLKRLYGEPPDGIIVVLLYTTTLDSTWGKQGETCVLSGKPAQGQMFWLGVAQLASIAFRPCE